MIVNSCCVAVVVFKKEWERSIGERERESQRGEEERDRLVLVNA